MDITFGEFNVNCVMPNYVVTKPGLSIAITDADQIDKVPFIEPHSDHVRPTEPPLE